MSEQTTAIRRKLNQLDQQANEMKIARNSCVISLATTPTDRAVAKRLAELNASIPSIDNEIAAYESALDHAARQDKADKKAAAVLDRRESADKAVQICEGMAVLDAQIEEIKKALRDAEAKRESARMKCLTSALQVIVYAHCRIDIYTSLVGLVSDAVAAGHPALLRWRLDDLLKTADQQDAILEEIYE